MPAPTNKDEVRRFLGVVTYLPRFSEDLSTKSESLRTLQKKDVLQSVMHHISEGWKTDKRHVPIQILPSWSVKDELSFSDGIVYRGDRIVIPAALRKSLTVTFHQAHMGIQSTLDVQEHPYGGQE